MSGTVQPQPLDCRKLFPSGMTCIEALAGGWINSPDLCAECTRVFMAALDSIGEPLAWHRNYLARGVQ